MKFRNLGHLVGFKVGTAKETKGGVEEYTACEVLKKDKIISSFTKWD